MSNVSIFEKKWIDLVFEGRNQAYGAYQLRQENPKTALMALLSALFCIATVSGMVLLLSSYSNKPIPVAPVLPPDVIITVTNANFPKKEAPKKEIVPLKKEEPKDILEKKELIDPKIVKANEKPDDVATNKENPVVTPEKEAGNGTSTTPIGTSTGTGIEKTPVDNSYGTSTTVELDQLPEFPGGLNKFREYVGNNFEKPEIDNVAIVKVLMSFVIEKDGSMTDIKVLRNPGYGLDKEAIRVLKSLKTKWTAGIKDGKKVRTLYTLPISIKME